MADHELAQINIGRLKAPVTAPEIAGFFENLDRINALADNAAGFVWRLRGAGNNATDIAAFDDPLMAINISVWTTPDALAAFVYRTAHRDIMRQRALWFEKMELFQCLWWVAAGHRPDPAEGIARLEVLRANGPTPRAFTFSTLFPAPGGQDAIKPILDQCA